MTSRPPSKSDMEETAKRSAIEKPSPADEEHAALNILVRDGRWMATPGTSEWLKTMLTKMLLTLLRERERESAVYALALGVTTYHPVTRPPNWHILSREKQIFGILEPHSNILFFQSTPKPFLPKSVRTRNTSSNSLATGTQDMHQRYESSCNTALNSPDHQRKSAETSQHQSSWRVVSSLLNIAVAFFVLCSSPARTLLCYALDENIQLLDIRDRAPTYLLERMSYESLKPCCNIACRKSNQSFDPSNPLDEDCLSAAMNTWNHYAQRKLNLFAEIAGEITQLVAYKGDAMLKTILVRLNGDRWKGCGYYMNDDAEGFETYDTAALLPTEDVNQDTLSLIVYLVSPLYPRPLTMPQFRATAKRWVTHSSLSSRRCSRSLNRCFLLS